MIRRVTAMVLAVALVGLISAPVSAKPKPTTAVYYLNWQGDCAGTGYLGTKIVPNADDCALFFPGLMSPAPSAYGGFTFPGYEIGTFKLNAKKPITVDFKLSNVGSVAADFVATVDGTVNGKDVTFGSATQQVTSPVSEDLHFELDPDDALDKGKVTNLSVTIDWTGGLTYSQIDFSSGAPVAFGAYK